MVWANRFGGPGTSLVLRQILGTMNRTDSWPNGDSGPGHYAQREAQGEHRVQHRMIDDDGDHGQHHDQSRCGAGRVVVDRVGEGEHGGRHRVRLSRGGAGTTALWSA